MMIKAKKLFTPLIFLSCTCLASCGCQHNGTMKEVSNTATCEEGGILTRVCTVCGKTMTYQSPALGHDFSVLVSDTATCTEDGYKTYKCSRCDKTTQKTSKAIGHDYSGCKCKNCGEIDPECISKVMEQDFSYSEQYTLGSGAYISAEVTWKLEIPLKSNKATFTVKGSIYHTSDFKIKLYEPSGEYMGGDEIYFYGDYDMVSRSKTIPLSRSLLETEIFYIKFTASGY